MDTKSRYLKFANKIVNVTIDRPLGSKHPKFGWIYPINYGYIPNTTAEDNLEIDVYVIDSKKPLKEARVKIIGIVNRKDDIESKLIGIIDTNKRYTLNEIYERIEFQEQFFNSKIELF